MNPFHLKSNSTTHVGLYVVSMLLGLVVLVSCVATTQRAGTAFAKTVNDDPVADSEPSTIGQLNFESPHAKPIVVHPDGERVYVVNTPSATVDVLSVDSMEVLTRVNVGIEPVSIGIRPDGQEVWVSNHVSDSVSVIDAEAGSPTYHQVLHTLQVFDEETRSTRFDEPVGIAFANNAKAYVALSSENRIAVVNVATRTVEKTLTITAQDPRAIAVKNDRLYVIPFESNNQTAVSGCLPENMETDPLCTFDADAHVVNAPDGNAQSLSLNYVLDIVRDPRIPDRDLYVFDTRTDELVQIVDTLGTLLYGLAVDSTGNVFVAQAEARNDANGKAGTEKHGMRELENRAFLNQLTKVDCTNTRCTNPEFIDLEPLPPENPDPAKALATPFGIQITPDDTTIVATAAASNKLFTVDASTGEVLDQVEVDHIPRGLTLLTELDGEPTQAWVFNALANSVSVVDIANPSDLKVLNSIQLEDPSDPILKQGRIAFNRAAASSTGTFACASCHPDGHTDQLLWVLDTPLCDVGCDQIQPRLVQDIRGLRGTAPYHWDGVPGDPFGGINTSSIETYVEPNCDIDDEESCTLQLIDGSLETTMCLQDDCVLTDDKPGLLGTNDREAMAKYLLSVPYPPSVERPYDNQVSQLGMEGFKEFHYVKQCGNCHLLPHWTTTNMGGSGMDLPSWRGANDRWKNAPQNRFFFADFVARDTRGFPERQSFTNSRQMYQMILEGSIGTPGSFARQVTLNPTTSQQALTNDLLDALEHADHEEAIVLQGEGVLLDMGQDSQAIPIALTFNNDRYIETLQGEYEYSRDDLLRLAGDESLLVTLTAYLGAGVDYDHPQPTLWPAGYPTVRLIFPGDRPQEFPELLENNTLRMRGDYIFEDATIHVNGRRVDGSIRCENGELPHCEDKIVLVDLTELPSSEGLAMTGIHVVAEGARMHLLQVQNPQGLFSNDFPFFVVDEVESRTYGNIVRSGGTFERQAQWRANTSRGTVSWNGEAHFTITSPSPRQPWRVSLEHDVSVFEGNTYSICYRAKSDDYRHIEVSIDTGPGGDSPYKNLMGSGFVPEVGGSTRPTGVNLNAEYREFHHRFVAEETDRTARLTFNLAQESPSVWIDDAGMYFGKKCGTP